MDVLFFTGHNCAGCNIIKKQMKVKSSALKISEIDIESTEGRALASKYNISSLPTMIVIDNGNPVKMYVGSTAYEKVLSEYSK